MNSLQRVQAVLQGQIPDRVPVCLHNFMMAAAEAGVPLERYRVDPEAIALVHITAVEKYGHDCVLVDTDTTMLAEAMGAQSACAPNEPGRIVAPAIKNLEEVDRLKIINPETDGRIPATVEGIRLIAKQVGGEVAIRGNADQGAFSLACLLFGTENFLVELAADPENRALHQLLEICLQSHLAVHRALIKAGAHFTSLGDSLAGPDVISPEMFELFAKPYEMRLVKELARDRIFTVIHICGDTARLLVPFSQFPPCGFELDYKTDPCRAKRTVGLGHVLFGNLDPSGVLACGSSQDVREKTRQLISVWKPGGYFVLNAGCAIPRSTPAENIRALIETAHEEGIYD